MEVALGSETTHSPFAGGVASRGRSEMLAAPDGLLSLADVVLGEFKRGKSTLINALLGRRMLLEASVETTVRRDFGGLVPHFEATIADQLTELERGYAGRVQRILEQVQEVAEDVFGARASDVLPQTGLRAPSGFSFKLSDVELEGWSPEARPGALTEYA